MTPLYQAASYADLKAMLLQGKRTANSQYMKDDDDTLLWA